MTNKLSEIRKKLDDLKQRSNQLSETEMKYRQNINDQIAKECEIISKAQKALNSRPATGYWYGKSTPETEDIKRYKELKKKAESNISSLTAQMRFYSDSFRAPERSVQEAKQMLMDAENKLQKVAPEADRTDLTSDQLQSAKERKYEVEKEVEICKDRLKQAEADFRNTAPFITKSVMELREELTASARKMIADKCADISEICSEVIAMASELEGIEKLERAYESLPYVATVNYLYTIEFTKIKEIVDVLRKKGN